MYYYITNLQGDVMSIVDGTGAVVASYEYDPYGNIISATGELAETNPLRYRGYVYDQDTGLYYLQSRYYDPQTGRFINADVYASTGQGVLGHNMFAYCNNNPTNYIDPTGNASIWAQLFKDFKFGVLHTLVELHILITHTHVGSLKREYDVETGRADIVNIDTGDVWEIKHGRMGYITERIEQACKQAMKYLGYGDIRQLGPEGTFNGGFTINCAEESYLVQYATPDKGVIIYTVTPQQNFISNPEYEYDLSLKKAMPRNVNTANAMIIVAGGAIGYCYAKGWFTKSLGKGTR